MNECLTWAALSDKAAVGEELSAEEQLYLRSHPTQCAACATEASLWLDLGGVLEDPERLTATPGGLEPGPVGAPQRRLTRSAINRIWSTVRARPLLASVASGGLVAAAAIVVVVARPSAESTSLGHVRASAASGRGTAAPQLAPMPMAARLAFVTGETSVDNHAGVAGETLATGSVISVSSGQACALAPPGVTVCLDEGSKLSIEKLETTQRRFRLHSGHVVAHLDPQPPGGSFGFETPAGSVVAKGTVFSLRTDGSNVTLRVHEGTVLNSRGSETSAYAAPSAALLSSARPSHAMDEVGSADERLIDLAQYFSDASQAMLTVAAAGGSSVLLGDFSLGMTPLSALVRPGDYRMEVSRPGLASIIERLSFEPGSRVARTYEASAEPTASGNEGTKRERGVGASSATGLLEQARELRSGRKYKQANSVYQRLLRDYPGSAEARVALVSLGELQLSQMGDAAGALRSFDAYLRGGGGLSQEASYGRIRALRQLGRANEARAASDAFLRAYPTSVQASTLRKEKF
jgi:tetratricopeptide (TPR) repeat protein